MFYFRKKFTEIVVCVTTYRLTVCTEDLIFNTWFRSETVKQCLNNFSCSIVPPFWNEGQMDFPFCRKTPLSLEKKIIRGSQILFKIVHFSLAWSSFRKWRNHPCRACENWLKFCFYMLFQYRLLVVRLMLLTLSTFVWHLMCVFCSYFRLKWIKRIW